MKSIYTLFLLFTLSLSTIAQNNYYENTDNLYGKELQTALYKIIKGHHVLSYSQVWNALQQTDKDTTNPSDVILFYTGWKRNGPATYNGGSGWNREHVWPKSHGFPSKSDTAYTDINHLRSADVSVNSARGNKDFDNGGSEYIDPDGDTGCKTDGDSWEPRDAVKGDVARIVFYMATRYEGFQGYDLQIVDYTGTSGSKLGKLSTLIKWNRLDPPDDYERNRNNVIFSIQHNRNPFIDRPEFADRIYLKDNLLIEKVEALSNKTALITFNKEIDSLSATETANYFIDKGIGHPVTAEPYFNGDKHTVLLHTKEFTNNTSYVLKVNGITSGGNKIADGSIAGLNVETPSKVELNTFTALFVQNKVKIFWKTEKEDDVLFFELERANEGNSFWEKIATVNATGTNFSGSDYSYYDYPEPNSGKYFYRLKTTELNGTYYYSNIVEVNTGLPTNFSVSQNFPNPFLKNGKTKFNFKIPYGGNVTLKIYNLLGQEISTLINRQLTAGKYSFTFDARNLSAGVYFYRLTFFSENGNKEIFSATRKMTILK